MKPNRDVERLIREYVSEVLKEDEAAMTGYDPGLATMYDPYGLGGRGGAIGTKQDLFKTFVKPFTDVVQTAVGQSKEITRRVGTLLRTVFEAVATTLIPFLTDSYDEIFEKEKQDLQKINDKYKDVYAATDEALSGDAAILAFMAFPGPALTSKSAELGTKTTENLLSVLTGGASEDYIDSLRSRAQNPFKKSSLRRKSPSNIFDSYERQQQVMLEDDKDEKSSKEDKIDSIIKSEKFISRVLQKSSRASEISAEARKIYREALQSAYNQAEKVLKAKSIDDIEKAIGKKLKEAEALKKLKPEEKKAAEEKLLSGVRDSIKKFYIDALKKQTTAAVKGGIPKDHPYVKDYEKVIDKINSL